jgi:hypothetical protein
VARRIEYRGTFAWPAALVYSAFTDREYLEQRLRALSGDNELVEFAVTEDGARFQLRQGVRAEVIPSVARTVVGRGVTIHRSEVWRREDEGQYAGEVTAGVPAMPRSITASLRLRDLPASASEFLVEGTVQVSIPLLGGKLEDLFVSEVQKLLADEHRFTTDWLS